MAVPPLGQRILHAREGAVAARTQEADRHRQVVDHVQHRDGHDEGEVEPVGDVDMRFVALEQRGDEHREIGDPHDRQPQVDVPFRLGIFLRLGDTQQVAGRGEHDKQLVAPEHEPGEAGQRQLRAAGALDDVEAGRQQCVAAEGEDHRRGVQRAQPSEIEVGFDVEPGEGHLRGDEHACEQADNAPEHRCDRTPAHDLVVILRRRVGHLEERATAADRIEPARGYPDHRERDDPDDHRVRGKTGVLGGDCHGQ